MDTKQTYNTPSLQEWGNVITLTQVGVTNPGCDTLLQGSVIPNDKSDGCAS